MLYLSIAIILIGISIAFSAKGIKLIRQKQDPTKMFNCAMIFFACAVIVYFIPMAMLFLGL